MDKAEETKEEILFAIKKVVGNLKSNAALGDDKGALICSSAVKLLSDAYRNIDYVGY